MLDLLPLGGDEEHLQADVDAGLLAGSQQTAR